MVVGGGWFGGAEADLDTVVIEGDRVDLDGGGHRDITRRRDKDCLLVRADVDAKKTVNQALNEPGRVDGAGVRRR